MIDTRLPCRCQDTKGESCLKCRPPPAAKLCDCKQGECEFPFTDRRCRSGDCVTSEGRDS